MKMGMKILRKELVVAANQRVLQCKRRMQRGNILEKIEPENEEDLKQRLRELELRTENAELRAQMEKERADKEKERADKEKVL